MFPECVTKTEHTNIEQGYGIIFCVKLHERVTRLYEKVKKAHGDHALSCAQVFRCHKEFLEGRIKVEDESRSERPVTARTDEKVERLRALIKSDRMLTVRML